MPVSKSFAEDMLSLAGDAVSTLMNARHDLRAQARQRAGTALRKLDLVTREEADDLAAMIAKARNAQEEILDRLTRIEKHLGLSAAPSTVKKKKRNLPSVKERAARGKSKRSAKDSK